MQGLKEGQILRTISNMTYSDSHYTSDEDKLGEVSVCRPVPLLTLQLRTPLGRQGRPWTLKGGLIILSETHDRPSLGFQAVHAYYVLPFVRGVILA